MRLIDADALIEYLEDEICKIDSSMEDALQIEAFATRANLKAQKSKLEDIIYDIEHGPSIDAVPVRHAKWISCSSSEHYKCSFCGTRASFWFDEENSSGWQMDMSEWLSDYCPHCGSRMLE